MSTRQIAEIDDSTRGFEGWARWEIIPDVVMPAQWNHGECHDASRDPEKSLRLAVLEEAIGTLARNAGRGTANAQRVMRDVEAWYSSDDTSWPFSFRNICDSLGFDAGFLRAGLKRWRPGKSSERAEVTLRIRRKRRRLVRAKPDTKVSGRPAA
jgi:hypothetical protein